MKVRGDDNPQSGTRVDVDVWKNRALADQAQPGQSFEKWRADVSALANENERLRILEPIGEPIGVLDVVGEDLDVMAVQFRERRQRPQRVEVVIENRDLHARFS